MDEKGFEVVTCMFLFVILLCLAAAQLSSLQTTTPDPSTCSRSVGAVCR
jgi:hypothetical protein